MQIQAEHAVTITNPDKLLWPEAGVTKADYMHYLIDLAPVLLHHLEDRPLTVIRYPDGVGKHSFYQKNAPLGTPDWVRLVRVPSEEREDDLHCIVADSLSTLLWMANLACLEFHVGFERYSNPGVPTDIAFDLDPTVEGFEPVREVAMALHELLNKLGLVHVAKTSGATGLQVFIPLESGYSYEDTRPFTLAVAQYLEATLPKIVTLERLKKNRGTKVYVDYLQHGQGRTLIAPYSARATRYATVSCPVTWGELGRGAIPEDYTIRTVPARVKRIGDLLSFRERANFKQITAFLSHSLTR